MQEGLSSVTSPKYCDKCGKNMVAPDGVNTLIGLSIGIHNESGDEAKFAQEQLGPYEINRTYLICWECWLRALGIPEYPVCIAGGNNE